MALDDDVATLPPSSDSNSAVGSGGGGSVGGGSGSSSSSGGGGGVANRFRNTSFMKWRQNNKSDVSGMNVDGEFKKWPHPPEALHKGKVTYVVKFLGFVNVEEPKGIEVVRSAIQKMKFNKTVKKAEGIKTAKKELVISVDSITIQDSKYKIVDHCYPLHRISFCADDKSDKRMFAFIAKDGEDHVCYVFDSEKCAEEITLTVGQAFEIAYQQFVEVQGKPSSSLKEEMIKLKNQVEEYEKENAALKARVKELEAKLGITSESQDADASKTDAAKDAAKDAVPNGGAEVNLIDASADMLPMSPAPHQQNPTSGRRLENLLFDEEDFLTSTTTPAATSASAPPLPSPSASAPPLPSPPSASSSPFSTSPSAPAPTALFTEAPPAAASAFAPQQQEAAAVSAPMPSLAPPPRPPRRPAAAAAAATATASASGSASASTSPTSTDLFGAAPFAPDNAAVAGANNGTPDPFSNHDDLFGMTPFQSEYQPPFQNPIDVSFGSGNFDFGSSFKQDFNQNNAPTKGAAPTTVTSGTMANPFIQFN